MHVTPSQQGLPLRDRRRRHYTIDIETLPMMVENDRKATLQALHTDAVTKAVKSYERNVVLHGRHPPIGNSEKDV